ncbi:MAG TPA: ATP-dependent zinc metalloprotease FtsH [Bacilli bacterium]|nr:ATP-dependent zinc metalloprotease FtsH [Bacilli bacterium]HPK86249.1 ATP-dependent zinc metalloprotease FtsH [Bacilli bacterium]
MNKQNQPKKPNPNTNKTSSFKFFLPYILLVILIGVIVYFTFFGQRNDIHQLDYISLQQWILDHDIVEVTTKTSPELVIINGMTSNGEHFVAEIGRENYDNVIFNMLNAEATIERWYQVDLTKPTFWEAWGPTILTLVAVTIIVVFIMTRLVSGANATNQKAMDFNRSRARLESKRTKTFKDVAGCDAEKQEMAEIVDYLKQPKKYTQFGAKIPNGILLVGPPGTGKTLLAKAVAGEAGVPFYSISGSDFVEMFVGVGAGRVRDMFRQAKKNAPCIVFIDELDAVGRQRGTGMGGGNDEREQTLNQLLVEMDGFSDNSGVIVIAATNRDDVLDPALLRAGRFDRKITVSLPDRKGRAAIFAVHARGKKISSLVDFDQLAKRTVGFSGADIESILNDAAILAVRLNKKEIDIYDIDEAIDRRIAGPARDSVGMNEKERRTVAYHEAGHAIIGIYNKNADKVQKITIIPRGRTGGHVLMTPEEDRFLLTKNELTARIIGYLAGRVSEEIFFDDVSTGAHNDIEMATRIARAMVTEYGMSSLGPIQYEKDTGSVFLGRDYTSVQKNFSQEVALAIDNEIRKIVSDAHDLARKTLLKHKEDLILIAETLLEKETINAEEIDYLLKHRSLDGFNSNAQKEQQKEVILTEEPPKETKVEKEKPSKKGEKEEA